jgi:hypothetical protein
MFTAFSAERLQRTSDKWIIHFCIYRRGKPSKGERPVFVHDFLAAQPFESSGPWRAIKARTTT